MMLRNAFLRVWMGVVVLAAFSAAPSLARQAGTVDPARQTMKQRRQARQQNADAAKESQASSETKSEPAADSKKASADKADSKSASEAKPASDTKATSSDKAASENKSAGEQKGDAGSKQDPAAVPDLARPGRDIGGGKKACQKGDTSPAGTVRDGMKKVIVHLPIGQNCRWEPQ